MEQQTVSQSPRKDEGKRREMIDLQMYRGRRMGDSSIGEERMWMEDTTGSGTYKVPFHSMISMLYQRERTGAAPWRIEILWL